MILGRRCFSGNTLHELRREHVSTTPRPLREVVGDVPSGFSDAIERATAKDRADRQPTAGALANELRAGLSTPSSVVTGSQPADLIETVAINKGLVTNSDVNAPTVLTVDALETSAPPVRSNPAVDATVYEPAKPQPVQQTPDMAAPTIAESAAMASSVTVPQVARPTPAPPAQVTAQAPASKSKAGLAIAIGFVLIMVLAAGVGGFWLWNRSKTAGTGSSSANVNTTGGTVSAATEISRYWLELEPAVAGGQTTKVAASVPIASGQSFKFHFVFNEGGYLYIFGPGENNQPTAFLTTKPLPQSGVTSNSVSNGVEFSFPSGPGNNITLDKNPGTDSFTIIFTKTPLQSPSFLNERVTGAPLSQTQQAELKAFVATYQRTVVKFEHDESNERAPFVRVKASPDQTGNPVVFDIRIQHN